MALIFLAAVIVAFGFFLLALQVFAALIAFKLGALAAFVALPWGVFNGTAWVAERPLGWVAGCAIRLFLLAFVASVSITFVDTLPDSFVLADGGALQVLFFGLTMSMLAWFAPQLASEVVQGQPQLSGADGVRAVTGAGSTAAGAGFVASRAGGGLYRLGKSAIGFARGGRGPRGGGAGGARPVPIDYARMKPPPTGSKS
jgi:type IV secretion system protein TrbL